MSQSKTEPHIVATLPLRDFPVWAVLERRLFDLLEDAWRLFDATYCEPDGSLTYAGRMFDRDGVDDFYEPFFSWPVLYRLGGSRELLEAAKKHWIGITAQMTRFGFVKDEYELGYDWFHQGESLIFFYALCAADPDDACFRERAERFAGMYLGDSELGNYDPVKRMIVAPHNGSGGPRWGVGAAWNEYRADQTGMKPYGLPLRDIEEIKTWDDLAIDANAAAMGQAMQERMGRGDTAVNLAATSLVTNAWLYSNDPAYAFWVREYVGAWRERAAANTDPNAVGLIPDNVGPSGTVGELHNGRWYGGHYGWTWPHGLHSVEPPALIAAMNDYLISGDAGALELARIPLRLVLEKGVYTRQGTSPASSGAGSRPESDVLLVPYRIDDSGWFDFQPLQIIFPLWLWWLTGAAEDAALLAGAEQGAGDKPLRWSQGKEEQGHEAAWLRFLAGANPDWPVQALQLALAQVTRRISLIKAQPHGPLDDDIHWWQRLNPVVVEILLQLTTGSPPALYNGGLQFARVLFGDAKLGRPGLPPDVAALVDEVADAVCVRLVNLSPTAEQELIIQAGAFGEDRIDRIEFDEVVGDEYPGAATDYDIPQVVGGTRTTECTGSSRLSVTLPPLTQLRLRLHVTRRAFTPSHTSFAPSSYEDRS